jgi:hypothetical protein
MKVAKPWVDHYDTLCAGHWVAQGRKDLGGRAVRVHEILKTWGSLSVLACLGVGRRRSGKAARVIVARPSPMMAQDGTFP